LKGVTFSVVLLAHTANAHTFLVSKTKKYSVRVIGELFLRTHHLLIDEVSMLSRVWGFRGVKARVGHEAQTKNCVAVPNLPPRPLFDRSPGTSPFSVRKENQAIFT
jgi:hypothetical protein